MSVYVDPAAVKDFYNRLLSFDNALDGEFHNIESSWNIVSQFWDDDVHRRFEEMFREFLPFIRRYLEACKDYESFVADKLDALEKYNR